jgi:hypothetical protein
MEPGCPRPDLRQAKQDKMYTFKSLGSEHKLGQDLSVINYQIGGQMLAEMDKSVPA